jgi:uncharacterized membrane protein YdbT with pleckstrin-like domain
MLFFKRMMFGRVIDKEEQLLYSAHRHWITIKSQMLKIGIFGYLLPIIGLVFITGFLSKGSYFFFAWLGLAFLYTIYAFFDWYLDAWLITDVSIIDTQWDGFFNKRSSRIDYESIESVDIEVEGIKQTLLNYGNIVLIKSSGVNVKVEDIQNPELVSSWISRVQSEVMSAKNTQDAESIKTLLADIIESHIKVNS